MRAKALWLWLAAGAGVVAAAFLAPSFRPQPTAAPHARQYLDLSACLLTDPHGIAPGTQGAPAWAAMQAASLTTHVMVSYLPDTGPADAPVMLNTFVQRQCGVIVTTGTAAAQVLKTAKANPHRQFVLVYGAGAAAEASASNTVVVAAAAAPDRIEQAIQALAAQSPSSGS